MSDNMGKNAEGYPDPTAGSAWRNIRKEENRREAERIAVISNLTVSVHDRVWTFINGRQ